MSMSTTEYVLTSLSVPQMVSIYVQYCTLKYFSPHSVLRFVLGACLASNSSSISLLIVGLNLFFLVDPVRSYSIFNYYKFNCLLTLLILQNFMKLFNAFYNNIGIVFILFCI